MNNTACSPISFDFRHRFFPPLYIFVFIIGLTANGWGLKSLLHNWKKLKLINVFLLHLGLADILNLLTLPFLMVYFMSSKWIFGDVFCKITRFCFNLNLYSTIGFLTCISVYRYLAIVHPIRVMGRLTVTHSVAISVMVWLLVSVQSLPDMFYIKTAFRNNTGKCFETTSNDYVESYLNYNLGWTLTAFCIPFVITVGCYGHMAVVLWTMKRTDKVQKQRSLKLLFILILLFSVCYIPYHVFKNLSLYSRVLRNQNICHDWDDRIFIARQIGCGLVSLNSALNPLVYLHVNEDITAQLRQLLQRAGQMFVSNSGSVTKEV